MNLEIYKKGQGKSARTSAYLLIGLLVAYGGWRFFAFFGRAGQTAYLEGLPIVGDVTLVKILALLVVLGGLLLTHMVLNSQKLADTLIDTEQEMRKVSWPTWPEVKSATLVVVAVTFTFGLLLWGFDEVLAHLFSYFF